MDHEEKKAVSINREKDQRGKPNLILGRVVLTGFIGGAGLSLIGYLFSLFRFSEISPNMLLQPFILGDWKNKLMGTFISIIIIGVLGIGAALLYYLFFRRIKGMWAGLIYGVMLWAIVFFLFNPLFPELASINELKSETLISSFCLYLLFGLFVGYSISFDYNELNSEKLKRALGQSSE
ncbi:MULTISPECIES: YqhR family membrane protein [Bacillus]|uniref:Membrane protein YqhR n=2 Tax=Bacillus TaxID=1386 RepID=A0A0M4FX45_9BACI|nr:MULTISPECIES: YqhR family membrane protein [Bacillus]ALC81588.1 hypothetical protein AM592_08220 [Bacillus gobiensis]MBP1080626.1 Na+/proline symporter [Bacillus capparidis]MED1094482.1 YqhR family membrane protein [Bacillus capparidis]